MSQWGMAAAAAGCGCPCSQKRTTTPRHGLLRGSPPRPRRLCPLASAHRVTIHRLGPRLTNWACGRKGIKSQDLGTVGEPVMGGGRGFASPSPSWRMSMAAGWLQSVDCETDLQPRRNCFSPRSARLVVSADAKIADAKTCQVLGRGLKSRSTRGAMMSSWLT